MPTYDNFLPHGFFQKLISKCSKMRWKWTVDKYQNSVAFTVDNVIVALASKSTWIRMNVLAKSDKIPVHFSKFQSIVTAGIDSLLKDFHPNMWYEYCMNPCEDAGHECVVSTGRASLGGSEHLVQCPTHGTQMDTKKFTQWYGKYFKPHFVIFFHIFKLGSIQCTTDLKCR